jgi:hypothetical protein
MRCVGCGSQTVAERPERTAQGYRRPPPIAPRPPDRDRARHPGSGLIGLPARSRVLAALAGTSADRTDDPAGEGSRLDVEPHRDGGGVPAGYLIHVAEYNLGLLMRLLTGAGMPREFLARAAVWLGAIMVADGLPIVTLRVTTKDRVAAIAISFRADPLARSPTSSTRC